MITNVTSSPTPGSDSGLPTELWIDYSSINLEFLALAVFLRPVCILKLNRVGWIAQSCSTAPSFAVSTGGVKGF